LSPFDLKVTSSSHGVWCKHQVPVSFFLQTVLDRKASLGATLKLSLFDL